MAFEHKRKPQTVLHPKHLFIMVRTKAESVGFASYVGLHHRGAENYIELIALELIEKRTEGTFILMLGKRLCYGYGVNMLFQGLLSLSFLSIIYILH